MKLTLVLITLLLSAFNVQAAYVRSAGQTITDTDTGLVWLSIAASYRGSYNDAVTNNPGWSYATFEEVQNLMTDFYPTCTVASTGRCTTIHTHYRDAPATKFGDFFGRYSFTPSIPSNYYKFYTESWTLGWVVDNNGVLRSAGTTLLYEYTRTAGGLTRVQRVSSGIYRPEKGSYSDYNKSRTDTYRGTFLVKRPVVQQPKTPIAVPEASSLSLLGLGLLGFFFTRRRS